MTALDPARGAPPRRQKRRTILLDAGLRAFAEHGLAVSIVDIIVAAGVSRGTFYNYFETSHDVLVLLGDTLSDELARMLAPPLRGQGCAHRVGLSVKLLLQLAQADPGLAAFLWRTGFEPATSPLLVPARLARDIAAGLHQGSFRTVGAEAGVIAVSGIILAGCHALSAGGAGGDLPDRLARGALLALGADAALADEIIAAPLPALRYPQDSLLARSRAAGQREVVEETRRARKPPRRARRPRLVTSSPPSSLRPGSPRA